MKTFYRTYDSAWNRTGYATVPQYPGQAGMTRDFVAKCPECGKGIERITAFPEYQAYCSNGHKWLETPIVAKHPAPDGPVPDNPHTSR